MVCQTVIPVTDMSQVGEARRAVARLSGNTRFTATVQGNLAIIVTELGTNLVRHAQGGVLLIQELALTCGPTLEIISVDKGPGIPNIDRALTDGYSTAGTAGNGLGAVRRLSHEFDIYSQQASGTVIVSRVVGSSGECASQGMYAWAAISVAAPNETECGDSWSLHENDCEFSVMVADGLGHGPLASEAAKAAVSSFRVAPQDLPDKFLAHAHKSLSGTRGAAVAMARVNSREDVLTFAGIGNISGILATSETRRGLCSHNGTVGVQLRKIQNFDYQFGSRDLLILHSDGLQSRWSFESYPGLIQRHPTVVAAVLFRDFQRGRDDLTVVVVRLKSSKA